ncbi:MAG: HD domain-containing protein [Gemmatimonadetes bacterium]|nr:HD domain-containing protein [Gemmatimonadota bacterium]
MTEAVRFLNSFAQALATMTLYPDGHPAREGAIDVAFGNLRAVQAIDRRASFSFLGDDVVLGQRPLRELRGWDWSGRLSAAGVQRLEFESEVSREEFESFLSQLLARLTLSALQQSVAEAGSVGPIRFGTVGIRELAPEPEVVTATIALSLREEAETVQWLHEEMKDGHALPLGEAEAVVRSLAAAMHGDQAMVLPLLQIRRYDEYTTTHSLNVCVLSMGLAEWAGLGARDVRAFGVAGLLHDVGKIKIPPEILNKAGRLTPEERSTMNRHPVEGAKIIIETEQKLDLAAVVAYEHHVMLNGGGYPTFEYPRECHQASKLAHVCDVYDALRTNRPYRAAWPAEKVLAYLEERAGTEFDPDLARAFVKMMAEWEPKVAAVDDAVAESAAPVAAEDSARPGQG